MALIVEIILYIKAIAKVSRAAWRRDGKTCGWLPGETHFHGFLALIGNHGKHACNGEARTWSRTWCVGATLPARISHNCLPLDLAKGHGLSGQSRRGSHHCHFLYQFWTGDGPFQCLLA